MKKNLTTLLIAAFLGIAFVSCSMDAGDNGVLVVSPSGIKAKATQSKDSVKIYYTESLSLIVEASGADWCTVSQRSVSAPKNGYDSIKIAVMCKANPLDEVRRTQVLVQGNELSGSIVVVQDAAKAN